MSCYHTVSVGGKGEIIEKKSRFIAEVYPVSDDDEAFVHLEEVKKGIGTRGIIAGPM